MDFVTSVEDFNATMDFVTSVEDFNATMDDMNSTLEVNISDTFVPRSGYDLPVIGLKTGQLTMVHLPAMVFISISLLCVLAVISTSFYFNRSKSFFNWLVGERFVVYLAVCDGFYHLGTLLSHGHYLIIKDHVSPYSVCFLYAFITVEFALAQVVLINVVAVNAFTLMFYEFQLNFGKKDYRLILHTYGLPLLFVIICGAVGHLGPNGQICAMDGVRSDESGIVITVLMTLVLISNCILYLFTWWKIRQQAKQVSVVMSTSNSNKAVQQAAKTMMMFVTVFLIQWWAYSVYGIWRLMNLTPPILLAKLVGIFSNLGGIMNAIVYVIIRWSKFKEARDEDRGNKKMAFSSTLGDTEGYQQHPLLRTGGNMISQSITSHTTLHSNNSEHDSGVCMVKV